MFAVVKEAGKQYIVVPGKTIRLDKKLGERGETVTFREVLLVADGSSVSIGTPSLPSITVSGTIVRQGRGRKIIILKYKPKKRYKKKQGHRQPYTEVRIDAIGARAKETKINKEAATV